MQSAGGASELADSGLAGLEQGDTDSGTCGPYHSMCEHSSVFGGYCVVHAETDESQFVLLSGDACGGSGASSASSASTSPGTRSLGEMVALVEKELSTSGAAGGDLPGVCETISKRATGKIAWAIPIARLVRNLADGGSTLEEVLLMVSRLPLELNSMYEELASELQGNNATMSLLRWLSCISGPFSLEELRWVWALDSLFSPRGFRSCKLAPEFMSNNLDLTKRVIQMSCGLARVVYPLPRCEATLEFIHPSATGYFRRIGLSRMDPGAGSPEAALGRAHARVARDCIRCFSVMESAKDIPEVELYKYASGAWHTHAREAETRGQCLETILEDFELPSRRLFDILAHDMPEYTHFKKTQPIHMFLEHGLYKTVSMSLPQLIKIGADVNARDGKSQTLLAIAVRAGQEDLVRSLRTFGADPNLHDVFGVSPLGDAVKANKPHLVTSLLYPHSLCVEGRNSREIRSILREEGGQHVRPGTRGPSRGRVLNLDPDFAAASARTPLAIAASAGHTVIVRLLLDTCEVDVNAKDCNMMTPLSLAAANGHAGVVRLLLEVDGINFNARDAKWMTPLHHAVCSRNQAVVSLMLETYGVDVNARDGNGQAPIDVAISACSVSITEMILQAPGVELNHASLHGQTPLIQAARTDQRRVVSSLLGIDRVDINMADYRGRTALAVASGRGLRDVVGILLSRHDVQVDQMDHAGNAPLAFAALGGFSKIVQDLLETGKVDINAKNRAGMTPFAQALRGMHADTAMLLFRTGKLDLSLRDKYGSTQLMWAASCPQAKDLIEEMLRDPKCDASATDTNGLGVLTWCVRRSRSASMLKFLLGTGRFDLHSADLLNRSVLSWAAEVQDDVYVSMLLAEEGVDVNKPDFLGITPLHGAAASNNISAMPLLLRHADAEVDRKDVVGRTPLFWALSAGNFEAACMLLWTARVNPLPRDGNGLVPLDLISDPVVRQRVAALVKYWLDKDEGLDFYGRQWEAYLERDSIEKEWEFPHLS